jgi:predicted nucleic acid-binding protein
VGITLDTGALIDLERRGSRMAKVLHVATVGRVPITVPAAVITEWWRGSSRRSDGILAMFTVEPLTDRLTKLAGEALAVVPAATAIDAMVMASASLRGDVVFTADHGDLVRLRDGCYPSVRVLRV